MIEKIDKDLAEYGKKYKQMDKEAQQQMTASVNMEKQAKLEGFLKKYLRPKFEKYESERKEREAILGHPEFDKSEYECKEYFEEELVEEKIEPIPQ